MPRGRCKYGRKADGRCRRKPKRSGGLHGTPAEHRRSAETSIRAIHRAYDEAIKSARCTTMFKRLLRLERLEAKASQNTLAAIGAANFTDPLHHKLQRARDEVGIVKNKFKKSCLVERKRR